MYIRTQRAFAVGVSAKDVNVKVGVVAIDPKGMGSVEYENPGEYTLCCADIDKDDSEAAAAIKENDFLRVVAISVESQNENFDMETDSMGYMFGQMTDNILKLS